MFNEFLQFSRVQDDRLNRPRMYCKTFEIITVLINTALKINCCTCKPARKANPGNMKLASLEVTVVQNYNRPTYRCSSLTSNTSTA